MLWFGDFLLSVFHIRTSCEPVEVKELMFWFHLLPLMGILSILMGGEGRHPRRTWRKEVVRWHSGRDPEHLSLPRGRLSSLWRRARASLTLWVLFSLSFCLILLDLVNYRSSSDRCRCVPFVKPIY